MVDIDPNTHRLRDNIETPRRDFNAGAGSPPDL